MDVNKESTNPQMRRYPVPQRFSTQGAPEPQYKHDFIRNSIFLTANEKFDIELSEESSSQGIIKMPKPPFELSRKKEND